MRKKIVAGNWKMNMDLAEGLKFVGSIDKYFKEKPAEKAQVILCPPFIHLAGISDIIKHGKNLIAVRVYDSGQAGGIYEGPIGLMDEDNAGEYGRKHHIDENIFQTIFEFIFE